MSLKLKELGEDNVILLEKEGEAGGLCRSVVVDGRPFDIGGGHFLDVRRPEVVEFLFKFMPKEEWNIFERDSQIKLSDIMISHPLEANIWQMPEDMQEKYLASIKEAGCATGKEMPEKFVDWILWKFGQRIASDYMLPYNMKMFSDELDNLGTYWLEKLPNVSFEETLKSIEQHKAFGSQPGHASFYYPKEYGYGEVWLRMAKELGDRLICGKKISKIDINSRTVECEDGSAFCGAYIITTIPWNSFDRIEGLEGVLAEKIKELKSSSIETRYVPNNLDTKAQWIYDPDPDKAYHRILVRHNFCANSRGYWLETRRERVSMYENSEYETFPAFMNEYAYPLNTINKPLIMEELLKVMKEHNIIGLGRWGEHNHYNSDVVVEKALRLAEELA